MPGKGQIILNVFFLGKPLKSVKRVLEQEEKTQREVVKRVAEIMGQELNYTGEIELFTVENYLLLAGQKEETASVCWNRVFCSGISLRDAGYIQEPRWRPWMWGQ